MNKTSIEWTHRPGFVGMTWNPIRARRKDNGKVGWACTHASTGCLHCYAESINKRWGTGLPFNVPSLDQVEFFLDEKTLQEPVRQKAPATIFVGDMFDLFHEAMSTSFILQIFGIMAATPRHTYQLLTKRADRMLYHVGDQSDGGFACEVNSEWYSWGKLAGVLNPWSWPLPNVWLGVSVENQKYADERIPLLERTPAAVRFLSVEPQLEEIWIEPELMGQTSCGRPNWVICGGESGPGARPFNLAWAESLLKQCQSAGVPFFMKQCGSKPFLKYQTPAMEKNGPGYHVEVSAIHYERTLHFKDRKGGDPEEWPESLRVRQFPSPQMELAK